MKPRDDWDAALFAAARDGDLAKASEALGLGSRQTLYKKLKRLAIDIGDFLQEDTEPGMQYRA